MAPKVFISQEVMGTKKVRHEISCQTFEFFYLIEFLQQQR